MIIGVGGGVDPVFLLKPPAARSFHESQYFGAPKESSPNRRNWPLLLLICLQQFLSLYEFLSYLACLIALSDCTQVVLV